MRFNPGDKCIVLPTKACCTCFMCQEIARLVVGKTVTLVQYIGRPYPETRLANFWTIEESFGGSDQIQIDESVLEKLPPPKREPLGDWNECPWQPKEVIAKSREKELVIVDCADYT